MKQSTFLNLNWQDLGKGLVVAVLTVVLSALHDVVGDGTLPTGAEWKSIGGVAITAALAYLMKNLFTNSNGQALKSEAANTTTDRTRPLNN